MAEIRVALPLHDQFALGAVVAVSSVPVVWGVPDLFDAVLDALALRDLLERERLRTKPERRVHPSLEGVSVEHRDRTASILIPEFPVDWPVVHVRQEKQILLVAQVPRVPAAELRVEPVTLHLYFVDVPDSVVLQWTELFSHLRCNDRRPVLRPCVPHTSRNGQEELVVRMGVSGKHHALHSGFLQIVVCQMPLWKSRRSQPDMISLAVAIRSSSELSRSM